MKFTVSSGELLSRLSVVGKAIATKSNIPILDHFLFTIKGDKLNIRGSDSEITIDTTLDISDVEGEGSYVIPGDKMSEYLRKLPEQPIHFNINVETNTIETTTLTGITKQSAYSAEEYPVIAGIYKVYILSRVTFPHRWRARRRQNSHAIRRSLNLC